MKTLTQHLSMYASYHRDPRNVATHFVGIPMIMLGTTVLLARPELQVAGLPLSPATLVAALAGLFYFRLDRRFGAVMALVLLVNLAFAAMAANQSRGIWLGTGIGLFVVGWLIQAVGHFYEGKKPAFVDDLVGLLVGPLFLTAEVGFAMGMRSDLGREIEQIAGPHRRRVTGVSAT